MQFPPGCPSMTMNTVTEAPIQDDTAERLIEALNQDGFVLYQQPIRPLHTERRAEAYQEILIRFREEEEKLLPPGTFIPVLESCQLMHILDRWVLNRVIKWIHGRRKADPLWNAPCSSINLSNDTLARPEFAGFVKQQLHKGRVSGRKFAFEIAEDDGHAHIDALSATAKALKNEGCGVTLTSYTGDLIAPPQLEALGIDSIKLDIDSVTTLHNSADSQRRLAALQQQCASYGVRTIAEFVERPATLEKLRKLGIDYAQGYGIQMPVALV
jgi:EAL domain-containing protein (putative c-di-GMP-specific phosphodiesterase class I)